MEFALQGNYKLTNILLESNVDYQIVAEKPQAAGCTQILKGKLLSK